MRRLEKKRKKLPQIRRKIGETAALANDHGESVREVLLGSQSCSPARSNENAVSDQTLPGSPFDGSVAKYRSIGGNAIGGTLRPGALEIPTTAQ